MLAVSLREGKLASSSLYAFASCITSLFSLAVLISSELLSHSVHLLSLKGMDWGGILKAATKTQSAVFYCCNVLSVIWQGRIGKVRASLGYGPRVDSPQRRSLTPLESSCQSVGPDQNALPLVPGFSLV
jgi:hypothetical protein